MEENVGERTGREARGKRPVTHSRLLSLSKTDEKSDLQQGARDSTWVCGSKILGSI